MFDKETPKVFLACGIGAVIGGLLMLQNAGNLLLTTLGLLAGGLTGYFSYRPMQVLRTVPQAFILAGGLSNRVARFIIQNRKPLFWIWLGRFAMCSTAFTFLAILLSSDQTNVSSALWIKLCISFLILVPTTFTFVISDLTPEWVEMNKLIAKKYNPVSVYCYQLPRALFYRLPKLLWAEMKPEVRQYIKVVPAIGIFFWHLFRLIHSDRRLLCGVDAMIGSLVGFQGNNVLLGFLAGGIFGVINYEIVSKRLLKLAPTQK